MNPDQDLRLCCVELSQELHGGEVGREEIVKTARRYYRFILGKDDKVTSAQIAAPHPLVAKIRREFENGVEE